jgi:membrane fusion protein, multidrug efflux system
MKIPRISASWLIAFLFLAAVGAWLLTGSIQTAGSNSAPARAGGEQAQPDAPAMKAVRVANFEARTRENVVRVTGHTAASRRVTLKAELDGPVEEVLVERGATVAEGDVIARIAPEDRKAALAEAEALLRQRQTEYEAAKKLNDRGYKGDIALAEAAAKLDAARAAAKRGQIEMANTVVAAPFAGVLEERPIELGSYVKTGDPIATIVDLDPVRVVGFVTERDIAGIRAGAPGEAVLPGGRTVAGKIAFVSSVADETTRTFRVELELPNPDGSLAEGLTSEIRIPTGTARAHVVSLSLLSLADDGRVGVKAVDEHGIVRFLPVAVLGNADRETVWVAGLPERVRLITVGQEFVKDGEKVEPVPAGPLAAAGAAG